MPGAQAGGLSTRAHAQAPVRCRGNAPAAQPGWRATHLRTQSRQNVCGCQTRHRRPAHGGQRRRRRRCLLRPPQNWCCPWSPARQRRLQSRPEGAQQGAGSAYTASRVDAAQPVLMRARKRERTAAAARPPAPLLTPRRRRTKTQRPLRDRHDRASDLLDERQRPRKPAPPWRIGLAPAPAPPPPRSAGSPPPRTRSSLLPAAATPWRRSRACTRMPAATAGAETQPSSRMRHLQDA